jgi:superfamily II DNA or RNA helicase
MGDSTSVDRLHVENTFSWLQTGSEEVREKLWKLLRFRDPNFFFNAAYRARRWDGYHQFFQKESGRFLTGLMPEVQATLAHFGRGYVMDDYRRPFDFAEGEVGEDYIKSETGLVLRDYQIESINAGLRNKRGIVWAPTSAGKTAMLQGLVKACPQDAEVLVLGNKKGLVDQNYEALHDELGLADVGRLYGGINEDGRIICATWQSCHKILPFLKRARALFVDEIHENMSPGIKRVYRTMEDATVRLAFSATPFKEGGTDYIQKYDTKGWIGPAFRIKSAADGRLSTKDLQERGILSSSECVVYYIDQPQLSPYLVYGDAVTQGIAENQHFHGVVSRLAAGLTGRTLIIVDRIAHGDALLDRMPGAIWVRGKDNMRTRRAVIERLKRDKGNVVAIATAGIFNTGINTFIHQLINAAGGKAEHTMVQRMGRGLRVAPDKDHLLYIDFWFRINDYLEDHSEQRCKIFTKEGHRLVVKEVDF